MKSFSKQAFDESSNLSPMLDYEREYRTYDRHNEALLERLASLLRFISNELLFLIGVVLTYIATHP